MSDAQDDLSINAWTGPAGKASGELGPDAGKWGVRKHLQDYPQPLAAGEPVDERDWRHADVGWGLVLPDNEAFSRDERAKAADASPPIKKLLAARPRAPVFRYRPDVKKGFLRRYTTDGKERDIALSGSERGIGDQKLPWYMLIVGSPTEIPWQLQYLMNVSCFTGRLDLDQEGLGRYVDALINDWKDSVATSNRPVVWAVDHGQPDITWLMRHAIADPVAGNLRADDQIKDGITHLAGAAATTSALIKALGSARPAFVLTTSHGLTSPLDDPIAMAKQLGYLVDDQGAILTPEALLDEWQPDGAIWYAHACCSAGSDDSTSYKGLVTPGSLVEQTLEAVGSLGARVAPLPRALLGAAKPARAFIGQVEPTFNYTLRNPENRQVLTATIQKALYNHMFRKQPEPVGMALAPCYRHVGELFALWEQLVRDVTKAVKDARAAAMNAQLMAVDRQSMVILGDPTAALPVLH
ncbi:MAG: hypothetical protein AABO58_16510 [Acidobacteriota bacterium]